jgi:phage terminase large subunit-like protein
LDPAAPENWHWSNPSLGYTLTRERLEANLAGVQSDPAALRDFRSQNLNISPEETAGEEKWLSLAEWDGAADTSLTLEALIAEAAHIWIGADAGGLDDLSAIAALGKCADGRFLVWSHQWVSRRGYEKRKSVSPYDLFITAGELDVFDGGAGDVAGFAEVVDLVAASGKLALIGVDSYGATELGQAFADCGTETQAVPQGWRLTPAISWIERRLADGNFRHSGATILRWNVSNVTVTRQGNAVSISKATAVGAGKIDGVAALLNAVACSISQAGQDAIGIYSDGRGLFSV